MLDARGQESAQARLQAGRVFIRRHRTAAILMVLAVAVAASMVGPLRPLSIALAVGACLEAVVAAVAAAAQRMTIARLALDPAAHRLPEVAALAERLASTPARRRFAEQLGRVLKGEPTAMSPYDSARLREHRQELAELAQALAMPECRIEPLTAVECNRLLTDAVNSPLFNPNLDPSDLTAALYRIRAGIAVPPALLPRRGDPSTPG